MKRGNLVLTALQGDFGKPRPALVVQANQFDKIPSVTLLPVTSTLVDAPLLRVNIVPSGASGLAKHSQVMIHKPMTVIRSKVDSVIGSVDHPTMTLIDRQLALFLGLAD